MSHHPIDCEEVIRQLFEYLDGELDENLGERIAHHLERCRDCFSRAEFERRLRERLRESSSSTAPEDLRQRIRHVMKDF